MSRELLQQALNELMAVSVGFTTDDCFSYLQKHHLQRQSAIAALQAELAKPPIEPIFCTAETLDNDGNLHEFNAVYPLPESLRAAGWKVKTLLYAGESSTKEEFVSVPVEPTQNMCSAGFECIAFDELRARCITKGGWPYSLGRSSDFVAAVYRAMINAAKDQK